MQAQFNNYTAYLFNWQNPTFIRPKVQQYEYIPNYILKFEPIDKTTPLTISFWKDANTKFEEGGEVIFTPDMLVDGTHYEYDTESYGEIEYITGFAQGYAFSCSNPLRGFIKGTIVLPDTLKRISSYTYGEDVDTVIVPQSVIEMDYKIGGHYDLCNIIYLGDLASWCGVSGSNQRSLWKRVEFTNIEFNFNNLIIPDSVLTIEYYTFFNFPIVKLTISDNVTTIKEGSFGYCHKLVSLNIGKGLNSIGKEAFYRCGDNLQSIKVSNENTTYHSKDNCLIETATNTLLLGSNNSIIPKYITSIADYAFYDCLTLKSISIPNNISNIGYSAFLGCSSLATITLADPNEPCIIPVSTLTFASSPLTKDSAMVLINNLHNIESEDTTGYLYLSKSTLSLLSAEEIEIATNKGWTVSSNEY